MSQLDICFVIDEFDIFINKNADAQYIVFKQKEIVGLLKKKVFKVVTFEDVLSNTQIFNSRFVNKIKNLGIDKAYKKSRLVVQAYNNKNKNLILTQSPIIQ